MYDELLKWKESGNRKPLILYGARQTGKTWLLKHFGEKAYKRLHYINFESDPSAGALFSESLSLRTLLPLLELYFGSPINPSEDLLVLDEIQEAPRALTSLKYFYEEKPELSVACAGSFIGLYGTPASFPVGKVQVLTLYPFSFAEYLDAVHPQLAGFYDEFVQTPAVMPAFVHQKLWNSLSGYYFTGGMPEAVAARTEAERIDEWTSGKIRRIQSDLILGYRSDFAKHSGAANANQIYHLYDQIPNHLSRSVDEATKRFRFKEAVPNAKRYRDLEGAVSWLKSTGLVHACHIIENIHKPLSSNSKQSQIKLYINDTGLLNAMLELPPIEVLNQSYGTYKGYCAENFVACGLVSAGMDQLFSWKRNTAEIEFLIQHNERIVPIEVKSGKNSSRAKSLVSYKERYKPDIAVKISGNPFAFDGSQLNLPLYAAGSIAEILDNLA